MKHAEIEHDDLPPLGRDVAFAGMTTTQFLGAFNDNLYKQLILLLAVDPTSGSDEQGKATVVFAAPFILFSSFAGFLADRYSKRRIIVLCKGAEVAIMLLGMAAFAIGGLVVPLVVLFLMGTHSAFFGPAKYGILPELLRSRDLPRANGVIQMTTFLAIIFGCATAGYLLDVVGDRLWIACGACLGIAGVGILTSLLVRRTPVADPNLRFQVTALAISGATVRLLFSDRRLVGILLLSSLFWFLGGVVQQTVNAFGKLQLELDDFQTSKMVACLAIGIAVGCALAGALSGAKVNFRLVTAGAAAMAGTSLLLALPTVVDTLGAGVSWETYARALLLLLGMAAGLFAVPLNVFLQAWPPEEQKGRVIGAMNLVNWIAICGCGVFYDWTTALLARFAIPVSGMFVVIAAIMVPVALFFHPKDTAL